MDLVLVEWNINVNINYNCKYEDVIENNLPGLNIYLDVVGKKRKTQRKGAVVNVNAKYLTTIIAGIKFHEFPNPLLIFPQRNAQVEMRQKISTGVTHQKLHFEEVISLKPHEDNPVSEDVTYTLCAVVVYTASSAPHYKVYCKNTTELYLFDDGDTTEKHGGIALMNQKENLFNKVSSLVDVKDKEARMKKSA